MAARRIALLVWFFTCSSVLHADNWPAWRGATGDGFSAERNLPTEWSAKTNIRWKVALPDEGNSTPIVWGDRIFLTQATEKGTKRSLWCLDKKNGEKLWEQSVDYPHEEPTHKTNPYCSASPATDGERVVVSHGSAGVYCYDFTGKLLWKRDLGPCRHIWGNAASPVIYKDLVFLNFGPGKNTFLLAMNKTTGKDVWKVEESGGNDGLSKNVTWIGSWSTPVIVKAKDRTELVMSWPGVVKSYNPENGSLIWSCRGLGNDNNRGSKLTYTSPVVSEKVIVSMGGYGGPAIALKTGGSGDITETHRLWRHAKANPQRIGSGVILGKNLYVPNATGKLQCLDVETGKELWSESIGATWSNITHADGKLYIPTMSGMVVVIAAKPEFELLARNPIGERTLSSLAVADGEIFLRTYKHLWCISAKK